MEIPSDLKYSREHEWVRLSDDVATVGITDFAQDQLGDIVYLELPRLGTVIEQFGKAGEIESVKSVSELFTPVGGEIIEVNKAAEESPEIVNKSPYGDGWLFRLRLAGIEQLDKLMTAHEYNGQIAIDQQ